MGTGLGWEGGLLKDSTTASRMEALVGRMEAALERLEALGHQGVAPGVSAVPMTPEEKAAEVKAINDFIEKARFGDQDAMPPID